MALQLFTNPDDTFKVIIYVGASKLDANSLYADTDEASLKEANGDDLDLSTVEKHELVFRRPSFGDETALFSGSVSFKAGEAQFNPSEMQMHKMHKLLKSWTLTPGVPTLEQIKALKANVAFVISAEMNKELEN